MYAGSIYSPERKLKNRIANAVEDAWFLGTQATIEDFTLTRNKVEGQSEFLTVSKNGGGSDHFEDRHAAEDYLFKKLKHLIGG